MSSSRTVDYGIDLGTTNSNIAILRNDEVLVVPSSEDKRITPSVVWFSNQPRPVVGDAAKRRLSDNPSGVARDFKKTMGNPSWSFALPGGERRETACELSAHVLRELVSSLKRVGALPDFKGAVVTVPAIFDQRAREDTMRAAQLAGFGHVELFAEPSAAALAFGRTADTSRNPVWLAYDLGGGTFDAALVRAEEGVFTIIDTDGDRQLGGTNLDASIVRQLLVPQLPQALRAQVVEPKDLWWQLMSFAERGRIELDVSEEWSGDDTVAGEDCVLRLQQAQVDALQLKLFGPTVAMCRTLLKRNGFETRHVDRIVLVGGPTRSPFLRRMIEHGVRTVGDRAPVEGLGIALDHSVDPMTAVAQGAALRAAAQRLPSDAVPRPASASGGAVTIELHVPTQVLPEDTDLIVAGTVRAARPAVVVDERWAVVIERVEGKAVGWHSEPVALKPGGRFSRRVALHKGRNEFRVRVLDAQHQDIDAEGSTFSVLRGMQMGEITLERGLGVANADGGTDWFFTKGEALPTGPKTLPFHTTVVLKKGCRDEIVIPIVEGLYDKANLNDEVLRLRIPYSAKDRDIDAGAVILVTLAADESRRLSAEARFRDDTGAIDTGNTHVVVDADRVREKLKWVQLNLDLFRRVRRQSKEIDAIVAELEEGEVVAEINMLLTEGSPDHTLPWEKAMTLALQAMRILAPQLRQVDELLSWEPLKGACERNVAKAREIVGSTPGLGDAWLREFGALCNRFDAAVAARDRSESHRIAFDLIPEHFQKHDALKPRVGGGTDPLEGVKADRKAQGPP